MRNMIVGTLLLNSVTLAQLPDFDAPHHAPSVLVHFRTGG